MFQEVCSGSGGSGTSFDPTNLVLNSTKGATFTAIVGHRYLVSADTLLATSEASGEYLLGCNIISKKSVVYGDASAGLRQGLSVFLIEATSTTVTVNVRPGHASTTGYQCLTYVDLDIE